MNKEEDIKILNNETMKTAFKEVIQESLLSDKSAFGNGQENKLKDVETVKVIINELLSVKKHLPSTTNLTKNQVHGLAKLKTINKLAKSPLIDEYIFNIEELKRSETDTPFNMLKGFFDLANNVRSTEDINMGTMDRILGRKGKQ
jgi:hypothetical protein